MELKQRTKRFGIFLITAALILRLTAEGVPQRLFSRLAAYRAEQVQTETKTGQTVRFSASGAAFIDFFRESPPPRLPEREQPVVFSGETALPELYYACSLRPDPAELLRQPLSWILAGEEPTVLILHTHTTESYAQGEEPYAETSRYRTLDENHNMLSIGDAVAQTLEDGGIHVIHDRQIHDYPSYSGSYNHARRQTRQILDQYPTIQLVLDLHRDASGTGSAQMRTEAEVDGEPSAQLMLVVGTDAGGLTHDNWQENLSLALKFHALLEKTHPGIMRPLSLRSQRFNQDISPGALLVEVGAAGNSRSEALQAAKALADAILRLASGTEWVE